MNPKLFAFDLDGTLLDAGKRVRPANAAALRRIRENGAAVALASGRLGCGVRRYAPELGVDPALVVLNGAEVYTNSEPGARRVYYAPLDTAYAEYLINYCQDKPMVLNFYYDDKLYSAKTDKNTAWTELYRQQTGVNYNFIDKGFSAVAGLTPSKMLFVGDAAYLDEQETKFQAMWGKNGDNSVYVCRTWEHYLEFMNPKATKALGLAALCDALGISLSETAAYGDAENDIPMLTAVGYGVAMKNAAPAVKLAAGRVTEMTNEEDWLAREWDGRFVV